MPTGLQVSRQILSKPQGTRQGGLDQNLWNIRKRYVFT